MTTTSVPTKPRPLIAASGRILCRFARNDSGATAIEYALIAGLIFLAAVTGINLFTSGAQNVYNRIGTAIAAT